MYLILSVCFSINSWMCAKSIMQMKYTHIIIIVLVKLWLIFHRADFQPIQWTFYNTNSLSLGCHRQNSLRSQLLKKLVATDYLELKQICRPHFCSPFDNWYKVDFDPAHNHATTVVSGLSECHQWLCLLQQGVWSQSVSQWSIRRWNSIHLRSGIFFFRIL